VMTVAQCYTPHGQKIQGKGLEPTVPGIKVKAKKSENKVTAKVVTPEQDPWVQQAVELISSGKPQTAINKKAS
jgi:C-terminal processing protease CtpA/Prc